MITVLVAAFQGERYLEEQLDSILNQTLEDIKVIISDDGSTDGTWELTRRYVSQYPGRVRCLRHIKKENPASGHGGINPAAANFFWLLSQAEDDYILLSDQDDVWRRDKVQRLLYHMKKAEKKWGADTPILLYSDARVVDRDLNPIARSFLKYQHIDSKRTSLGEILVENPATGGAMMFNAALLSYVKKAPGQCMMHDWWIALAASCFGRIKCVREPLYDYRQHGNNTLGAKKALSLENIRQRLNGREQVREQYNRMFAQASSFLNRFETRLTQSQEETLKAFLSLPHQGFWGKMKTIRRNHFYKSSRLLTAVQCITMPRR